MDAARGAFQDVSYVLGKLTKSTGKYIFHLNHFWCASPHVIHSCSHRFQFLPATGKAAWIAGTAFLILIVPLIIEMDREQQLVEFESQQLGALTGGSSSTATPATQ